MSSFIVTIGELLEISRYEKPDFDHGVLSYVIPKYQREYKWSNERVVTLITDIKKRDKFLGNVFINKVNDF